MKIDKLIEIFQKIRTDYPSESVTNQDILKLMELKIRLENRSSQGSNF